MGHKWLVLIQESEDSCIEYDYVSTAGILSVQVIEEIVEQGLFPNDDPTEVFDFRIHRIEETVTQDELNHDGALDQFSEGD